MSADTPIDRQVSEAATTSTSGRTMDHASWMRAAEEEYRRLLELLRGLADEDWTKPTDCTEWDVRELVAHLAGAARAYPGLRELTRQQRVGKPLKPGADSVDQINAAQVHERAEHTPAQLLEELEEVAPEAVQARGRVPRVVRALPVPFGPPLGTKPLGYLFDRILTRDQWLHRIDLCRAVGREPELTADHDRPLVSDAVGEWASRHRQPFHLTLTGPAGGRWGGGEGGEVLELDAVEFCRIVSGRAAGDGLLATRVNF